MLSKRIIPCLDVKHGKVIKGVKFQQHEIVGDIVELAKRYTQEGADELVFYDIVASPEGRTVDYGWVEKVAKEINIPFTVAGGIRTTEQMAEILKRGADKISINTPALEDPDLISRGAYAFGSQCIVIGMDSHLDPESNVDYVYAYTGDQKRTKNTKKRTIDWVQEAIEKGAGEIVLNSINTDGVRKGYDIRLLKSVQVVCTIPLVASGGAGSKDDFLNVFEKTTVDAALAASVFHKCIINIQDLKEHLRARGIEIRM